MNLLKFIFRAGQSAVDGPGELDGLAQKLQSALAEAQLATQAAKTIAGDHATHTQNVISNLQSMINDAAAQDSKVQAAAQELGAIEAVIAPLLKRNPQ